MRKIINSNSEQYQPVLTDNLVLDAEATEGSFNAITSDAVFKAVQEGGGGGGSEIPEHKKGDRGKYLRVSEADADVLEWANVDASIEEGEGIKVDGNEVSVKAGLGLVIGDYRKTTTVETDLYADTIDQQIGGESEYASLSAIPYICTFESLSSPIGSGVSCTLDASWFKASMDINDPDQNTFYCIPAIVRLGDATSTEFSGYERVLGLSTTAISSETGVFDAQSLIGSRDGVAGIPVQFNLSTDDINYDVSNLDLEDVLEEPWDYCITFALVNSDATQLVTGDRLLGYSSVVAGDQEFTAIATYTTTRTVKHSLNIENPLPTATGSDHGKVLSVNNIGVIEWASVGGGSSNTVVIDLPRTDASDADLYSILSTLDRAMYDQTPKAVFGRIHYYIEEDDAGKDFLLPMTKHVDHGATTYYFTTLTESYDEVSQATTPMTLYYYECQIGRDMDGMNPFVAYYTGYLNPGNITTWTPYPSFE